MVKTLTIKWYLCMLLLGGVLVSDALFAQQDPVFAQYYFNPIAVNPAYAGSRDALSVNAIVREQWMGVDGRPQTQTFSIHTPLKSEELLIGFMASNDKAGPIKNTNLSGAFGYRIRLTEKTQLSFAGQLSANMYTADLMALNGISEEDPSFTSNIIGNSISPNAGVGMYLYADQYFIGISAPKLLENEINSNTQLKYQEQRHYFLSAGYVFPISAMVKLKPTAMARYIEGAPVSADVALHMLVNDRIWVGGMYRTGGTFGMMASLLLNKNFRLGYAYEQLNTELGTAVGGTHEIFIGFDFIFNKDRHYSPRYF